jgi:hypothetical protein
MFETTNQNRNLIVRAGLHSGPSTRTEQNNEDRMFVEASGSANLANHLHLH